MAESLVRSGDQPKAVKTVVRPFHQPRAHPLMSLEFLDEGRFRYSVLMVHIVPVVTSTFRISEARNAEGTFTEKKEGGGDGCLRLNSSRDAFSSKTRGGRCASLGCLCELRQNNCASRVLPSDPV